MVGNDRGQKFPVDIHQVCTHCRWYPGPFFHLNLLKRCVVLRWLLGNTDFQLPPQTLYWSEVQRLTGPLLDQPDGLRQTLDGPGRVLTESRGTFQVLHDNVVWNEMATFVTVVSVLFRSLTSSPLSSGLFSYRSQHHFFTTGWDLARSPRSREWFSINCFSHQISCLLLLAHPSYVQVHNPVPGVLRIVWPWPCCRGCSIAVRLCGKVLYTNTSSNRCH